MFNHACYKQFCESFLFKSEIILIITVFLNTRPGRRGHQALEDRGLSGSYSGNRDYIEIGLKKLFILYNDHTWNLYIYRFLWVFMRIKFFFFSPGWCVLMDWAPAYEPKGHWFDSQSGHMPGLPARSRVGGMWEATTHWCFSPSLSPSLLLCLKINKILKNNKKIK